VLDELAARGLRPGIDVTVTGFDDVPAAAAGGLTTIRQPLEAKGRAAIECLLDDRPRVADRPTRRVILATELVVRASSGTVPD
jgi:DNA-binding LacI/PurR family transcriptional regulator